MKFVWNYVRILLKLIIDLSYKLDLYMMILSNILYRQCANTDCPSRDYLMHISRSSHHSAKYENKIHLFSHIKIKMSFNS